MPDEGDVCNGANDGDYCGSEIGGDDNTLYTCEDGSTTDTTDCSDQDESCTEVSDGPSYCE